ncbi:MAG: FAD:protein FMN transferase [Verrucomicrobiota bacterium]
MNRLFNSPMALRLYRAGVLLLLIVLVHEQARWFETQRAAAISLRVARKYFKTAHRVELRDAERGLHFVSDLRGDTIGCLLTTSPQTDQIIGYSGPNNLLIALDARGTVVGIEMLHSGDTEEHVGMIKRDARFLRTWIGWKPSETSPPKIEGVSGATLTSFAIAEAIQQRLAGAAPSLRFPEPITLAEIQSIWTNAVRFVPEKTRLRVFDASGIALGFAVRTSPQADNVSGYRGPTDCLVGVAPDGKTVTAIRVRRSYDTDSYVDQIRKAESFLNRFIGRTIEELAQYEFPAREKIEGVSGATMTARAVAEGLQRRSAVELRSDAGTRRWFGKPRDWALGGVIAGALILSFTSLRGVRAVRWAWQILLVGFVGWVNHDFLSLALFSGWAAHGLAWKAAPGLVLLAAAAFLVPWGTRRQLYCHQICPHGAAQQLIGQARHLFKSRRHPVDHAIGEPGTSVEPSQRGSQNVLRSVWLRRLETLPVLLLIAAFLSLLIGLRINLVALEPFDAWSWPAAGWATLTLAVIGLIAAAWIPQAYCRFGCPTGALLGFLRSSGSADHWSRRDGVALVLVFVAMFAVMAVRAWPRREPAPEPLEMRGRTMGTSWSIKIHDEIADPVALESSITKELEWAESMTSHWRTNTDLSIFNRSATTNLTPVPWPVLTLTRRSAEISRATGGAYDITVGPLVRLWGFGPGTRRNAPPNDNEIADVLSAVGWQKLELADGQLRKLHPQVEIDLSSIAKGWAIDHVSAFLDRRGYTNFLVEIGGELRARGLWKIAIEHPTRSGMLTNESIATSGTYRQNFASGKTNYSHLIDPRTGRPVQHKTVSVSVRHTDCAQADAWATALNVLGAEEGLPLANRLGLKAEFVVELQPGRLEVKRSSAISP